MRKLPLLLMAACVVGCWKWSGTDVFVSDLRCGMSEAEIRTVVDSYPGLQLRRASNRAFGELVAAKSGTMIWLDLDSRQRLYGVFSSWTNGYASAAYALKRDLCTGLRSVHVRMGGPDDLAGADIYLDNRRVAALSPSLAVADMEVPLGSHQVRVEKCGYTPWVTQLRYAEDSNGYVPIDVPLPTVDPTARCGDTRH